MQAYADGNGQGLDALLQNDNLAKFVNVRDNLGMTPLMYAVRNSDYQSLAKLLQNGADPTMVNQEGQSALHLAIQSFESTNVEASKSSLFALLAHVNIKNFINLQNKDGQTPLISAIQKSDSLVKEYLSTKNIDDLINDSSIFYDLLNSIISIIENLLSKGADPAIIDKNGNTSLHHAFNNVLNVLIIPILLAHDQISSFIDVENNKMETVLVQAIGANMLECIRLLLNKGADITIGYIGYSVLQTAIWSENWEIVKLLLENENVQKIINLLSPELDTALTQSINKFVAEENEESKKKIFYITSKMISLFELKDLLPSQLNNNSVLALLLNNLFKSIDLQHFTLIDQTLGHYKKTIAKTEITTSQENSTSLIVHFHDRLYSKLKEELPAFTNPFAIKDQVSLECFQSCIGIIHQFELDELTS